MCIRDSINAEYGAFTHNMELGGKLDDEKDSSLMGDYQNFDDEKTVFDEAATPGNSWMEATFLIMASIVGVGVLGLPNNFAKVGWVLSILFLFLGAYCATYSGVLIYEVCEQIYKDTGKRVTSFPDMGAHVWGEENRRFFDIISYTSICLGLIIQQLVLTSSFQSVVANAGGDREDFCLYAASGVIAFVMLAFTQKRSLQEMGWTAVFGVTSIAVPLVIVFSHAISNKTPEGDDQAINSNTGWGHFCSNLVGGVVFAFSGQILFPNFIGNMAKPEEFPKCVYASSAVMTLIYLTVACCGYALLGSKTPSPVTDDLGKGAASVIAELVLIFHVVVGYAIGANVFNSFVYLKLWPDADVMSDDPQTKIYWFLVTLSTIAFAFMVANLIPVFSDIVNLNGSTLGVMITYNIPALMYLKVCKCDEGKRTRVWCFFALGCGMMAVGTIGGIVSLADDLGKNGVFPCVKS
eukprot:TRINITY_DN13713_c0_g1_i4.p1 TRINITY_DN13713_c0_g1~~TRINITY_DN13713_c0_g1_i4.p1  ORF type:complete len:464 (+),score=95.14 TRINITY_DN13713_c0_g1_i4:125-1516(+)